MHFKSQEKRRAQTSNLINTSFSSVLLYFNFTSTVPLLLFPTFFSCKCHTSENTQGSFLHILTTDEIQADVNTAWGVPECDRAAERHSPSFCLPPSRGAITADTESTISALTEPPPTHASTQNVTHLDNWKVCPPTNSLQVPEVRLVCFMQTNHVKAAAAAEPVQTVEQSADVKQAEGVDPLKSFHLQMKSFHCQLISREICYYLCKTTRAETINLGLYRLIDYFNCSVLQFSLKLVLCKY